MSKQGWGKPPAWAIHQNEDLWEHFDSVEDPSVVVQWSLGDNYRTKDMLAPGDPALFWLTGANGGITRLGFVLRVEETAGGHWTDSWGKTHEAPFAGHFFLAPFPDRRYIHRDALAARSELANCELLTNVAQSAPPLRIEPAEWDVILQLVEAFDASTACAFGWMPE